MVFSYEATLHRYARIPRASTVVWVDGWRLSDLIVERSTLGFFTTTFSRQCGVKKWSP